MANLNNNGGEHLLPEFKAYIGNLLAEEDFEASQPGRPGVRRDQDVEIGRRCQGLAGAVNAGAGRRADARHWQHHGHLQGPTASAIASAQAGAAGAQWPGLAVLAAGLGRGLGFPGARGALPGTCTGQYAQCANITPNSPTTQVHTN